MKQLFRCIILVVIMIAMADISSASVVEPLRVELEGKLADGRNISIDVRLAKDSSKKLAQFAEKTGAKVFGWGEPREVTYLKCLTVKIGNTTCDFPDQSLYGLLDIRLGRIECTENGDFIEIRMDGADGEKGYNVVFVVDANQNKLISRRVIMGEDHKVSETRYGK